MIVVEGPDGAGKTTLIKQLTEAYDIPIAPRVVTKDAEAMVDLKDWVDNQLEEGFQDVIFDRHRLISETIYGPILRTAQEAGFNELSWVGPRLKRFYELEPIIIYCLPSLETVKRNIARDDDNRVVMDQIEAIYSSYVSRISLDHIFSPGIVKVWDYEHSPKIDGRPTWLYEVRKSMQERLVPTR